MRKVLRGLAWVLGGFVVAVGALLGYSRLYLAHHAVRTYALAPLELPAADADAIERGRHLATTRGCAGCHGEDFGGHVVVDAGPVGRFVATNITPGGRGKLYDPAHFEHALRHGVSIEGKPLLFMPSTDYAMLSDADVAALAAYLATVPAVDRVAPQSKVGPLGGVLYLFGQLPLFSAELIDHAARRPAAAPPPGATPEYGRYVAASCTGCHGEGFSGGHVPGTPPDFKDAANLTPHATGLAAWSEADFVRAMREGKRPDGSAIDPFMPWQAFGKMDEVELKALWAYLATVPAKPRGAR